MIRQLTDERHRRAERSREASLCVFTIVLLSAFAVTFIGGSKYADLQGRLWAFAVLGTLLAMIQLLIYNIVARQRQRAVLLVWAAMAALLASTPFIDTLDQLLTTVLTIDGVLFVVLLARSLAPSYHRQPVAREPAGRP